MLRGEWEDVAHPIAPLPGAPNVGDEPQPGVVLCLRLRLTPGYKNPAPSGAPQVPSQYFAQTNDLPGLGIGPLGSLRIRA
ncbi:MAG: hypothetical protein P8020_20710, partial [Acidobacteriota bacterium]